MHRLKHILCHTQWGPTALVMLLSMIIMILMGCSGGATGLSIVNDGNDAGQPGSSDDSVTITATPHVDAIGLSWDDASSEYMLRRSTSSYPSTIFDGTSVYQGMSESMEDSVISPGTSYYYTLFVKDGGGVWNAADTHMATVPTYADEMRSLVGEISDYAKGLAGSQFIVIPAGSNEIDALSLLTDDGTASGTVVSSYTDKIDGVLEESLYYADKDSSGGVFDADLSLQEAPFFSLVKDSLSKAAFVVDYVDLDSGGVIDNYLFQKSKYQGLFFRENLSTNSDSYNYYVPYSTVTSNALNQVSKYAYVPESLSSAVLSHYASTDFDMLVLNPFADDASSLDHLYSTATVTALKQKSTGNRRLVLAYINIGRVHASDYYWDSAWDTARPSWVGDAAMDTMGPSPIHYYQVQYWQAEWKDMLFGNTNSLIHRAIAAGYDGVVLGNVDAQAQF